MPHRLTPAILAMLVLMSFAASGVAAEWACVDDFDACVEGEALAGRAPWSPLPGYASARAVLLEDGNIVARIEPGQALCLANGARGLVIPEGESGVLFFKIRAVKDSRYWGGFFGMATLPPQAGTDFAVAWTLGEPGQGSRPNATFATLEPGDETVLLRNRGRLNEAYEGKPEFKPGVWYQLWITIDNERDETLLFIQGGDFGKRAELTAFNDAKCKRFRFQRAASGDLSHFAVINPADPDEHNPRSIEIDGINFMALSPPGVMASDRR